MLPECYRHAEDCAPYAEAQPGPALKQDLLDAERHWIILAQSYEFTERLTRFTFKPKQ
jgi:hypothetical protein